MLQDLAERVSREPPRSLPHRPKNPDAESQSPPLRVLWIDDEPAVVSALSLFLKKDGCRVDSAPDGASGVEAVRRHKHDVIILDWVMPGLSGLEVLEQLRPISRVPVIVLTAFGTIDRAVEAIRLGVAEFKAKPISGPDLCALVRTVVSRYRREPQNRPLFRPPGAGEAARPVRALIEYLDKIDRASGDELSNPAGMARERLLKLMVRAVADPDVSFYEFVAVAQSILTIATAEPKLNLVFRLQRTLNDGIARNHSKTDPRFGLVLQRFEGAGPRWGEIAETMVCNDLEVSPAYLRRLIGGHAGLTFPECRRAIVIRPVVLELALTDEQVAQIAFKVGYLSASQMDHDFARFMGISPKHLRNLL